MQLDFRVQGQMDGRFNMAEDIRMLEEAENRGLLSARVYEWDGVWVSLGRFQMPDRDLLRPLNTKWVQRPTGGKAVLHGHDMTVSIAAPIRVFRADARSIKGVYRAVIRPLVEALNACGMSATLGEEKGHTKTVGRTADCFAVASANDVVDQATGQKVGGCALRLTESAVLLQASIPFRQPEIPPAELIAGGIPVVFSPWKRADLAQAMQTAMEKIGE